MGQKGFWDEQERVSKLKNKKPVFGCFATSMGGKFTKKSGLKRIRLGGA